jgi:hypothetical protein
VVDGAGGAGEPVLRKKKMARAYAAANLLIN